MPPDRSRSRRLALACLVCLAQCVGGFAQASADRVVALDEASLEHALSPVLARVAPGANSVRDASTAVLPTPDGGSDTYVLTPVPVMAPELQARYPELRSYEGFRQNLPHERLRATYSPSGGWRLAYGGAAAPRAVVYAETRLGVAKPDRTYRLRLADELRPSPHSCGFAETLPNQPLPQTSPKRTSAQGVPTPDHSPGPTAEALAAPQALRRYRLALTCTGEYARAVGGATPTKASVLAAMVTAVNRINEVYERDLGITFELVANNDALIFLDPATDPYDNADADALLRGSHTEITRRIGTAGFDIGHVFATGGAGLATLASVCDPRHKGQGATGISNPANDFFYIDYVAHEIGHQLGATHTFYNSCSNNRSNATAFEPGSGSTIMAYAGICAPNVQNRSDDYFHAGSLAQVRTVLAGTGSCAQSVPSDNEPPVITAATAPPEFYYIPTATPFLLEARATDPNGDALTYAWEQMDNAGTAPQPPAAANVDGPLFRSLAPTSSPRRVFATVAGQYATLPSVARDLNFRLTVRDNRRPAGATASHDVRLRTVPGAAAFEVLDVATDTTAQGYGTQEITYRVGVTRQAPIGADRVDVFLSPDRGLTYSDTLAVGLPNTGSLSVTLPNVDRSGRLVVRGHGNVFFAVSRGTLTIQQSSTPTLLLSTRVRQFETCVGERLLRDTLRGEGVLGFSESVRLRASGLPAGMSVAFDTLPQNPGFVSPFSVRVDSGVAAGEYRIGFTAIGVSSGRSFGSAALTVTVVGTPLAAPTQVSPADGSRLSVPTVGFALHRAEGVPTTRLQLSRLPKFVTPLVDTVLATAEASVPNLDPGVYYWRAAGTGDCGDGPWSDVRSFQVLDLVDTVLSDLRPVVISNGTAADYEQRVTVPTARPIYRYEVSAAVTHVWVGDLSATLRLPDRTTRKLFGQPSGGDCAGSDLAVTLSDQAAATADQLANTCGREVPSISGRFRASEALGAGLPESLPGEWTLVVRDNAPDDGGRLERFDLRYWVRRGAASAAAVISDTLFARTAARTVVPAAKLRVTDAGVAAREVVYVLRVAPRSGKLYRAGAALSATDTFSQASIAAGRIAYQSDSARAADSIVFDVLVGRAEFFPHQVLTVSVGATVEALGLGAASVARPACAADASGVVVLDASGGVAPYRFGVGSGALQASERFADLVPGAYEFRVVDARDSVRWLSYTLGARNPFAVAVEGSRVRVTSDGSVSRAEPRYSFDGGTSFSTDSVGYVYAVGTARVVVRLGSCTFEFPAAVTRPLTVSAGGYRFCPGSIDPDWANVCLDGGVGPYAVTFSPAMQVFQRNGGGGGCDSIYALLPTTDDTAYTVTITDRLGATASATAPIVNPKKPDIRVTQRGNWLTVAIEGNGGPYVYGLRGQQFQESNVLNVTGAGPFDVLVRDRFGCVYVYERVTATSGPGASVDWRVYPNPTRGQLTVEFDAPTAVGALTVRNVTGQVVLRRPGEELFAKTVLDLGALPAGYYVLELRTDAGTVSRAVVKE